MKPGALWPIAVVGVLAVTVGANVYLLVQANAPNASVVEPDYYREALGWDTTAALAARSERLGWNADAAIGRPDASGNATIEVRLADRDGRPVTGATVRVTAIHNLDAARHVEGALAEVPGGYGGTLPLRRSGLWELRLSATRDTSRFLADLRRDAGSGFAR